MQCRRKVFRTLQFNFLSVRDWEIHWAHTKNPVKSDTLMAKQLHAQNLIWLRVRLRIPAPTQQHDQLSKDDFTYLVLVLKKKKNLKK